MNKGEMLDKMEVIRNLIKEFSEETDLYITASSCGELSESNSADVTIQVNGEYYSTTEFLTGNLKGMIYTSEWFEEE